MWTILRYNTEMNQHIQEIYKWEVNREAYLCRQRDSIEWSTLPLSLQQLIQETCWSTSTSPHALGMIWTRWKSLANTTMLQPAAYACNKSPLNVTQLTQALLLHKHVLSNIMWYCVNMFSFVRKDYFTQNISVCAILADVIPEGEHKWHMMFNVHHILPLLQIL